MIWKGTWKEFADLTLARRDDEVKTRRESDRYAGPIAESKVIWLLLVGAIVVLHC